MSNLPKQTNDSQQPVREFFDNYFNENLTFPGAEVDAVVGYFESRGFDRTSSISTASVVLKQAKIDNVAVFELLDTLNSRWIGQGPKVELFEKKFSEILGSKNKFIATGSGTDSLHLAYLLAGIKAGDEVITPVFTCTATNLPLLYEGATPVFTDIDPETLNINFNDIEHRITKKTKAIVAVDYGGIPAKYDDLLEICKKYNLKLIADCAQSIGSKYKNLSACEYADFTTYSFQAIKTITTSDGGMLSIKEPKFVE